MPISVEEIKKLAPKAEVYALDSEATHIIALNMRAVSMEAARGLMQALRHFGIKAAILHYNDGEYPLSLFEVK